MDMYVQDARHLNLRNILALLERMGVVGWEAQADYVGRTVTPRALRAMARGGRIGPLFAEHVEYIFDKPRGWMDDPQGDLSDIPALPRKLGGAVLS